jgi:fimbrial chaperone protein
MRLISLALAAPLALLCLAPRASASAIVIWPVDPTIIAGQQATALWLENKGDAPVTMQVRAFAWSQRAGEDTLDAQDNIVASPPIARVEPGQRQLVRIIRRAPDAATEASYRLIVDELPPAPTDANGAPQARLAVQMRYSVPLFTYAAADKGKPAIAAQVRTGTSGRELVLTNTGQAHARLTDLRFVAGAQQTVVRGGLAGYVLPGASIVVPLPAGTGSLRVGVNGVDQALATGA